MKILVFSDSHGNVQNMEQAVRSDRPDYILHLGDVNSDARALGKLFPATWGYALLTGDGTGLLPLLGILSIAAGLCAVLLRRRMGARAQRLPV